jgi:hypothetical protein
MKKKKRLVWRRKQLDPSRQYGSGRWIDFDLDEPYCDVMLVPAKRCTIQSMDFSLRAKGVVRIAFVEPRNHLHALLYTVEA